MRNINSLQLQNFPHFTACLMTYIKSDLIYILHHFYLVISRAFDPKENSKKYPYTYYKDEDSRRYSEEREVRNNHLRCI